MIHAILGQNLYKISYGLLNKAEKKLLHYVKQGNLFNSSNNE